MFSCLSNVFHCYCIWLNLRERFDNQGHIAGHGITAVIQKGDLIEKGAVSTTLATGILSKERASSISSRRSIISNGEKLAGSPYFAAALSLVLHSKSPMVPTFRADIRFVFILLTIISLAS